MRHPASRARGFTLVEIVVALGIFALLAGIIFANYQRGSDDSVLSREVVSLMSNVRLLQEQNAAGKSSGHCRSPYFNYCLTDADCLASVPGEASNNTCLRYCSSTSTTLCNGWPACTGDGEDGLCNGPLALGFPPGGYQMVFSCKPSWQAWWFPGTQYPNIGQGATPYFVFADWVSCGSGNVCFPFDHSQADETQADGIISREFGGLPAHSKGDPLVTTYTPNTRVVFKDLRLTDGNAPTSTTYTCSGNSAWKGTSNVPGHPTDDVALDYPLQATIAFNLPTARTLTITDNMSATTPSGNRWAKLDLMLGVQGRSTGCRVVTVAQEGTITQSSDADCTF